LLIIYKITISRHPLNFINCWDKKEEFELPLLNDTTFAMEFDGHLNWNDSTLPAYLNSFQSESILIADQFQIAAYNERHPNDPLNVLDEVIFGFYDSLKTLDFEKGPETIVFEKASILLRENGILNRIISKYSNINNFKPKPEPDEPKVLSLGELGFGFKIVCAFLFLAMIAFAFEIISARLILKPKTKAKKCSLKERASIQLEVLAEIENDCSFQMNDQ